jgi:Tfp pilus assembly protein PilO
MRVLKKNGVSLLDAWQDIMAKNRKMAAPVICGIVIFLILFFVVLAPTRRELADKKKRWRELETLLLAGRNKLDNFKVDKPAVEAKVEELRRRLPSKSPTSAILEELTKKGRQLNIDFISIAPKPQESLPQLQQDVASMLKCRVLPISINMRATYKNLGEYLGLIENLESSFATVNEFQVTKDERIFPKLIINMNIYTYVLEEAGSEPK